MAFALTWMPAVLEEAGLMVAETSGWSSHGRAEMGRVLGVMVHHTVGPRQGNMPSLNTLVAGRSNLRGPLANLGLGRDGTWYCIAAGRANHAGEGVWKGVTTGNANFIGIECENTGGADDLPWPEAQMLSLAHGVAALLKHTKRGVDWCIGHKEFAPHRKPDPLFDMAAFRRQVADIFAGTAPLLQPIAAVEPSAPAPGVEPRVTLRRPSAGPLVKSVQTALGLVPVDGIFGAGTEAAVREWQRQHGLLADGIVGPETWPLLVPH